MRNVNFVVYMGNLPSAKLKSYFCKALIFYPTVISARIMLASLFQNYVIVRHRIEMREPTTSHIIHTIRTSYKNLLYIKLPKTAGCGHP